MLILLALMLGAVTAQVSGSPVLAALLALAAIVLLPARTTGTRPAFGSEVGDISTFVPEFWIRELLRKLRHAHVFGQPNVANRNYQGTISAAGDTVTINSIGEVTVKDYTKTGIDAPEELSTTARQLLIDQQKYFNFMVDDIDAAQAAGSILDGGMESAAFNLRDVADSHLASFYTDADAANAVGSNASPETISKPEDAYFYLNRLGLRLTNAKVGSEGRFAVLPPWFYSLLSLDKRFTDASAYGSTSALLNGEVGRAAGFTLLQSHNAPSFTGDGTSTFDNDKVIAGVPLALSFAEQINKVVPFQPEDRFGDAVKGLHVYGARLIYPKAWAVGSFTDGVGDTPPAA